MRIQKIILGSLFAAVSVGSFAAGVAGADLKVTGSIVPASCTPSLVGGGTLDFGTIQTNTLDKSDFTFLGDRNVDLTIICGAPLRVAITFTDSRSGTSPNGIGAFIGTKAELLVKPNDKNPFGFGSVGEKKVGAYIIMLDQLKATVDTAVASIIQAEETPPNWGLSPGLTINIGAVRSHSWALRGATNVPAAGKVFVQPIKVYAAANKVADLPEGTAEMALDGQVTITVGYI